MVFFCFSYVSKKKRLQPLADAWPCICSYRKKPARFRKARLMTTRIWTCFARKNCLTLTRTVSSMPRLSQPRRKSTICDLVLLPLFTCTDRTRADPSLISEELSGSSHLTHFPHQDMISLAQEGVRLRFATAKEVGQHRSITSDESIKCWDFSSFQGWTFIFPGAKRTHQQGFQIAH